jgi:hypothetical protein
MNVNELKATRGDHFEAAEKLIAAARVAGKDLTGADLERYENHVKEIKNLDGVIAHCYQLSGMNPPENNPRVIIPIGRQRENRRGSNLRDAFANATAEEREQVVALAAYPGGGRPYARRGRWSPHLIRGAREHGAKLQRIRSGGLCGAHLGH